MPDTLFTSKALNQALAAVAAPSSSISTSDVYAAAAIADLSGQFAYKLTSMNGGESTPSSEFYHYGVGSGVSVFFTEVAGATNYRLYRSPSGASSFALVGTGDSSPVVDTAAISGDAPPTGDTTNSKSRSAGTLPTVFYECTGGRTLLKEILANSSNTDTVTFDVHFVPSGEPAAYGNALLYNITLEQNELKIFSLNTVLEQGDTVQAKASSIGTTVGYGVVNLKFSGIEIEED